MLANIEALKSLHATAEIWIYYDDSINGEWLKLLQAAQRYSGIKISLKEFNDPVYHETNAPGHQGLYGTLARYHCLADFTYTVKDKQTILLIRDADMIINQFDLNQIEIFSQEEHFQLHRYIDKHHYDWPIIGGSFAIKSDFLNQIGYTPKSWHKRIENFATQEMKASSNPFQYFVDQRFLKEIYQEITTKKCLSLISTLDVHIPLPNDKNKKSSSGHYQYWWCDIADDIPDFSNCKNLKKWLTEHSDEISSWLNKASQFKTKNQPSFFISNTTATTEFDPLSNALSKLKI